MDGSQAVRFVPSQLALGRVDSSQAARFAPVCCQPGYVRLSRCHGGGFHSGSRWCSWALTVTVLVPMLAGDKLSPFFSFAFMRHTNL